MEHANIPRRTSWKQDLGPYLEVDAGRSLGQIASVVLPYLGVWVLASVVHPNAWLAIGLGVVATMFLVRMYSFFHDLTHNSMFESRAANSRWGHLLGLLLFTPYRWWQRQHRLHHAQSGNLDKRGVGEMHTMTLAEYESASPLRRIGYRAYRNPLLMLFVGPSLVFLFARRFPQRGMSRRILLSVGVTNLVLVGWAIGWSALVGWPAYLLIQATTLVAGGAVAAWMLYIQHQYEDTYYQPAGDWQFELAALQGSSYLKLPPCSPGWSATPTTTTCTTSARRSPTTGCVPRTRSSRCSRARQSSPAHQPPSAAPQVMGRGAPTPRALPDSTRRGDQAGLRRRDRRLAGASRGVTGLAIYPRSSRAGAHSLRSSDPGCASNGSA